MARECIVQLLRFYIFFGVLLLCMLATGSCELIRGVRLAGSRLVREGRVEVYVDGEWGTIMDQNTWGENEARAVCTQIGFGYDKVAVLERGYYGQGTGPVHFTNVRCPEGATSLRKCTYRKVYSYESTHDFDAAVTCHAEIRLHGGSKVEGTMNGVIQLFSNSSWRSLCTSRWTAANSEVVCRSLGYSTGRAMKVRSLDSNQAFYRRDYHCEGNERSLEQCPHISKDVTDCAWHDHFITCSDEVKTTSSSQRDSTTFTLSTISGSLVFLVIVIAVLLSYLVNIRRRGSRHRRWITLANGRQQCQPTERERRRMRRRGARRVRGRNQRREAPNVYSISNGQRGNDRDLPPYSRLEEDIPPPYSQLQLPRIEIPVVGREERYEDRPPRYTETDAIEYFQELDAEQLRLRYENAAVERSRGQPQCPEQPPPDYATAANPPVRERPLPVNNQNDVENTSQTGSISSDDEVDDISLSGCRSPIPVIPKDTVNINATVMSVEV